MLPHFAVQTARNGGRTTTSWLGNISMEPRRESLITVKPGPFCFWKQTVGTDMPATIWDGCTCWGRVATKMRKKHSGGSGMPWKPFRRRKWLRRRKDTCVTESENATHTDTVQSRTMKNPPSGSGRRWTRITPSQPTPWLDSTSGGRVLNGAMRRPTVSTIWRQPMRNSLMPMPNTSSERCTGMGSVRRSIRRNPDCGTPKPVGASWPWKRTWRTTACTTV